MNRWIAMAMVLFLAGALLSANATGQDQGIGSEGSPQTNTDLQLPKASQPTEDREGDPDTPESKPGASATSGRTQVLIASLTIFMLAVFVGFEVITKVPPTLHTPLMSGSNAISGITIIGAILVTGVAFEFSSVLGFIALVLAAINVVGGFLVTHRMLSMFAKR